MEIVLLERVEKLGQMGDVVTVKTGYARNFLLPQGKALRANKGNMALFESRRAELEARNLVRKQEAEAVASKMEGTTIVLVRQAGETGQLYGSVNARDVMQGLEENGYKVERRQVVLDRPIKTLGIHELRVLLHPEVALMVSVNVARSEAEAEMQARGEIIGLDDDYDHDEDGFVIEREPVSERDDEPEDSDAAEMAPVDEAADETR